MRRQFDHSAERLLECGDSLTIALKGYMNAETV